MQFVNKTFVVTGAGGGIGRELASQLLKKGASVAAVDINPSSLRQTEQLAGVDEDRLKGFILDITDKQTVDAFPATVIRHFGSVEGLINNAGIIQPFKPVQDLSGQEIDRVFAVNFFGTLNLTRAFLPYFLARPEAHITNVSSMGGFIPVPGQTLYGAAKAAVKLLTEGLYAELIDTHVRVTVVFPGAIATNISQNSGLTQPKSSAEPNQTADGPPVQANPRQRIKPLAAEEAARQILAGIERNQFRVVVGKDARFLDLLYRLNPRQATRFIQKQMKVLRQP